MHSKFLPALLFLVACATDATAPEAEAPVWGEAAIEDADLETNEDPGWRIQTTLSLAIDQLVPGDETTFVVTGAGPGELVHIARSMNGFGSGPCLGSLSGLCLDVRGPVSLHASVNADGTGTAVFTQTLPEFVPIGSDVSWQAVVPRGATGLSWVKSSPITVTTEDAPLVASGMVPGDLVITEVMIDPLAVSDANGEWFEIENRSGLNANLDGLTLTDGINQYPLTSTHFLAAGDQKVFGVNTNTNTNGGVAVDWEYAGLELVDQWGELYVMRGGTILDGVAWDDGASFPLEPGVSLNLPPAMDHVDNNIGVSWCGSLTAYGDGDLGSPGDLNPECIPPPSETVGSYFVRPADSATLITGAVNNQWLSTTVTILDVDEALSGSPLADMGLYNRSQGDVFEYTFDMGLYNAAGNDLVIFDGRWDVGHYRVSAEHDGFSSTVDTNTWVSTGVTQSYFLGLGGSSTGTIWAGEIDLTALGIADGDRVFTIRVEHLDSGGDPMGIGAL